MTSDGPTATLGPMNHPPLSIYSTWGLHDELGDNVQLTEALATRALDGVLRWRDRHGLTTDIFHLDTFWFDPVRGYRHFHPEFWPQGPDRLLARLKKEGMRLGLWYSTTGSRLNVPAWAESRTGTGDWAGYSLVDGPYFDHLRADLLHISRAWDIGLHKFDFVDFGGSALGITRTMAETRRRASERLTSLLCELKAVGGAEGRRPAHIIVHCGFARQNNEFLSNDPTQPHAVDAGMLEGIDGFFSGDPQPSDLPATRLTRAADLYQDHQVRKMLATGFPLPRIEDHGAMCASTNTANQRKNSGLRRSHLGSLARGGKRDLFYGDPDLADDGDVVSMKKARAVFHDAWAKRLETAPVGGEPGIAPWHGWMTGGARRGLLWLVNPSLETRVVRVPIVDLAFARVLFRDGLAPLLQVQHDVLLIELLPEQALLIGLGHYADAAWDIGEDPTGCHLAETRPVALTWTPTITGCAATLPAAIPAGRELLVTAMLRNMGRHAFGPGNPIRYGKQHIRTGPAEPVIHDLLRITVEVGGKPLAHSAQVPATPVWSGMSWVLRRFSGVPAGATIRVEVDATLDHRMFAEAWSVAIA